jgi:hypothetical protein
VSSWLSLNQVIPRCLFLLSILLFNITLYSDGALTRPILDFSTSYYCRRYDSFEAGLEAHGGIHGAGGLLPMTTGTEKRVRSSGFRAKEGDEGNGERG